MHVHRTISEAMDTGGHMTEGPEMCPGQASNITLPSLVSRSVRVWLLFRTAGDETLSGGLGTRFYFVNTTCIPNCLYMYPYCHER